MEDFSSLSFDSNNLNGMWKLTQLKLRSVPPGLSAEWPQVRPSFCWVPAPVQVLPGSKSRHPRPGHPVPPSPGPTGKECLLSSHTFSRVARAAKFKWKPHKETFPVAAVEGGENPGHKNPDRFGYSGCQCLLGPGSKIQTTKPSCHITDLTSFHQGKPFSTIPRGRKHLSPNRGRELLFVLFNT